MLENSDSGKKRDCIIYVAKTKVLISYVVICVFIFVYVKSRFSPDQAQFNVHFYGEMTKVLVVSVSAMFKHLVYMKFRQIVWLP